jgi:hypothetical protein
MAINNAGLFLPTTYIIPEDSEELRIRLSQYLNNIAYAANLKDTGYYPLAEFVSGQSFFPNPALAPGNANYLAYRPATRKVINFGTLPNAATKSVAHGISVTNAFSFTRIYATATNPAGLIAFPIPTTGTTITVDSTNVNITTSANMTAYTTCIVVIEYLKY